MSIAERLRTPLHQHSFEQLAGNWFHQVIEVVMPGFGALAGDMDVLRWIRGSWGRALMEGASREAVAGQPCPFLPPCALDVFFREQGRNGRYGIPKPWVLATERKGRDLRVRLTVFGFATEWSHVAAHCLCDALLNRVNWSGKRHEFFLPQAAISGMNIRTHEGVALSGAPGQVELFLQSPVDTGNQPILDQPAKIFCSLMRHLDGLARWQDAQADADWKQLVEDWQKLDYGLEMLDCQEHKRRSGRQKKLLRKNMVTGSLTLSGNLFPVWPLLLLGQSSHLGSATTFGFGRYHIHGFNENELNRRKHPK